MPPLRSASDIERDLAQAAQRMKTVREAAAAERQAVNQQEPNVEPRPVTIVQPPASVLPEVKR